MECRVPDGPSLALSSNQVTMPPKFQPTRGSARRRANRTDSTHHLRDENTDSKKEIQEIGAEESSPGYQTKSIARQQASNPQSDGGDDSSTEGSSSTGDGSDLMRRVAMRTPALWPRTLSQ
ncbi:hypothetical protein HAX54_014865 [Datura stramonium]|uniref:Uncharacterized protein n=1 Tax=Datura stramonium TaxID=4076 RepID=A0ABS8TR33_DATST|nr:hypothetical protein [Datura stramonium]